MGQAVAILWAIEHARTSFAPGLASCYAPRQPKSGRAQDGRAGARGAPDGPGGSNEGTGAVELTPERPDDWWEVEALYDLCFAPGREALSSYRLRDGVAPIGALCRVGRDEPGGPVACAIRAWPVRVGRAPAALVGPVAVHPTRQGEGLGATMMADLAERATAEGWPRLLLVGDAPYYGRFGYARLSGVEMPPPTNPDRVLGWGDWSGVSGPVLRWCAP
jgi:predicted N-acetyltransferase YhbS